MFTLKRRGKNDIKAENAYELIKNNKSNTDFIILDVRSHKEYSEAHIDNAKNIDYNARSFKTDVEKMDKTNKYLIYCLSGHRSSNALKVMTKLGFTDLHNLSGGIKNWKNLGLPLVS